MRSTPDEYDCKSLRLRDHKLIAENAQQIGGVEKRIDIFPPVVQAPMSAITNLAMRDISESFGCPFTITEFLPATSIAAGNQHVLNKITPSRGAKPYGVQIYGRNPRDMEKAAQYLADRNVPLIDINMGCPGKRIKSASCGAALMREPQLAQDIVQAVYETAHKKSLVSVKMRAGWDSDTLNAPDIATRSVAAGACMITVHGRTRQQKYSGTADYGIIREVKTTLRHTKVPVLANGDITDLPSMRRALDLSHADGAMIGRAAIGNPWIFPALNSYWSNHDFARNSTAPDTAREPTAADRITTYLRHLKSYIDLIGEKGAVIESRKFAAHYLACIDPNKELLRAIYTASTFNDVLQTCNAIRAS